VRWGRVFSHWMVCMKLTNKKLHERGQQILSRITGATSARAARTLKAAGSLPVALLMIHRGIKRHEAQRLLARGENVASLLRASSESEVDQQPSPRGRGCLAPALSPAGARRVRGHLPGSASSLARGIAR